jgi:hypothetical protein
VNNQNNILDKGLHLNDLISDKSDFTNCITINNEPIIPITPNNLFGIALKIA